MKLTRREFLRASAAFCRRGGASVARSRATARASTNAMAPRKAEVRRARQRARVASTCGCTQWCAIQIFRAGCALTACAANPLSARRTTGLRLPARPR